VIVARQTTLPLPLRERDGGRGLMY
jgi:hypothetical protein